MPVHTDKSHKNVERMDCNSVTLIKDATLLLNDTTLNSVWGRSVAMLTNICHMWSSLYLSSGSANSDTCTLYMYCTLQFTSIPKIQLVHRYNAIFLLMECFWTVNKDLFMYITLNWRARVWLPVQTGGWLCYIHRLKPRKVALLHHHV